MFQFVYFHPKSSVTENPIKPLYPGGESWLAGGGRSQQVQTVAILNQVCRNLERRAPANVDALINRLLSSGAMPNQNLQEILEEIVREFAADTGTIHLLENSMLILKAHFGLPPHIIPHVSAVPIGKGMAGQAAERNEPVSVCNLLTDESGKFPSGAKATGVNGAIVVPIRDAAGQMQGTLGIGVRRDYEYAAEEIEHLLNLAAALLNLPS
jgi:L-methionine (R)-S-oxide reductase